jgi:hypothetical protein
MPRGKELYNVNCAYIDSKGVQCTRGYRPNEHKMCSFHRPKNIPIPFFTTQNAIQQLKNYLEQNFSAQINLKELHWLTLPNSIFETKKGNARPYFCNLCNVIKIIMYKCYHPLHDPCSKR